MYGLVFSLCYIFWIPLLQYFTVQHIILGVHINQATRNDKALHGTTVISGVFPRNFMSRSPRIPEGMRGTNFPPSLILMCAPQDN